MGDGIQLDCRPLICAFPVGTNQVFTDRRFAMDLQRLAFFYTGYRDGFIDRRAFKVAARSLAATVAKLQLQLARTSEQLTLTSEQLTYNHPAAHAIATRNQSIIGQLSLRLAQLPSHIEPMSLQLSELAQQIDVVISAEGVRGGIPDNPGHWFVYQLAGTYYLRTGRKASSTFSEHESSRRRAVDGNHFKAFTLAVEDQVLASMSKVLPTAESRTAASTQVARYRIRNLHASITYAVARRRREGWGARSWD